MKHPILALALAAASTAHGAVVLSNDSTVVRDFQLVNDLRMETFENVEGRTAMELAAYTSGLEVPEAAQVHDEIDGLRISVGGTPGVNRPALYRLGGGRAGDAASPDTVLGPVDFDGTTLFNGSSLLEIFFTRSVSAAGFWVNPALGGAKVYATNTLFAFSGDTEEVLDEATVGPGGFVGFSYDSARIGGLKVLATRLPDDDDATPLRGFTIDDLSYSRSASNPVAAPSPAMLLLAAAVAAGLQRRRAR